MANVVTISGMFGSNRTYFADSPVVITISGLAWPSSSPFTIVRLEVIYDGLTVGEFRADTAGQTSISFDISSALRALWSDYDFSDELAKGNMMLSSLIALTSTRLMRSYSLCVHTEYISSDGVFTETTCEDSSHNTVIPGGYCLLGGFTEMERSVITNPAEYADVSHLNQTNLRYGDASTKPTTTPERIGRTSITSWVDVAPGQTVSKFYPYSANPGQDSADPHAPMVLRDSSLYVDFLFVNRRGAVETCSGQTMEAMGISVDTQQYAHVERPSFTPSRSLTAISRGGRRSWNMSSGLQTRDWAEWWAMEFLKARRWWMRYPIGKAYGTYVPVIVTPANSLTPIYDRSKQQMPSVDFTVTMALEG